jgi:hypothetical protein
MISSASVPLRKLDVSIEVSKHPCKWKPPIETVEPVEEVELQAFPMTENFLALNAKNVLEIDAIFYHT